MVEINSNYMVKFHSGGHLEYYKNDSYLVGHGWKEPDSA